MTTPAQQLYTTLERSIGRDVFGMRDAVHGLTLALVAQGHVLIEGVPGLGKTLLAKTLAGVLGGRFKRVQCTSDLMPADITGIHVYNAGSQRFEFVPGPLFADVVLVDEINRTGPKTQSALLEAMEERSVTIDRETYALAPEFFLVASQNPHEFEGTYPLPESQLDRFLLRLKLSYPAAEDELTVLRAYDRPGGGHARKEPLPLLPEGLLEQARQQAAAIHVAGSVYRYAGAIAQASRQHPQLSLGLSTRGALALVRCARVLAATRGADFVTPDDIKEVAVPVMGHRLVPAPEASLEGLDGVALCQRLLTQVEVPRE